MVDHDHARSSRDWIATALLAGAYFLLGRLALEPAVIDGDLGRVVWPATGVALAALLRFGVRLWPGVFLGAFLTTASTPDPLVHAVATAIGNTLEVVLPALLLRRVGFELRFARVRDVLALVAFAGVLGATLSGTFGVAGLYLGELAHPSSLMSIWWRWCLGHAMGAMVLTPFLLTVGPWIRAGRLARDWIEPAVVMVLLLAVGHLAFPNDGGFQNYDLEYLPFPLLIWAAYRFGVPGAAAANLITSGMAVLGTASGSGPFTASTPGESLLLTWSFVNVTAVTTLLLAAVLTQARRAQEAQRKSESQYQMLIDQAADGILIADGHGRCTDVNRSGCEILGYERDVLLTRSIPELIAADGRDAAATDLAELRPGQAAISNWSMQRRNGSRFPAEISVKRLEDGRSEAEAGSPRPESPLHVRLRGRANRAPRHRRQERRVPVETLHARGVDGEGARRARPAIGFDRQAGRVTRRPCLQSCAARPTG